MALFRQVITSIHRLSDCRRRALWKLKRGGGEGRGGCRSEGRVTDEWKICVCNMLSTPVWNKVKITLSKLVSCLLTYLSFLTPTHKPNHKSMNHFPTVHPPNHPSIHLDHLSILLNFIFQLRVCMPIYHLSFHLFHSFHNKFVSLFISFIIL